MLFLRLQTLKQNGLGSDQIFLWQLKGNSKRKIKYDDNAMVNGDDYWLWVDEEDGDYKTMWHWQADCSERLKDDEDDEEDVDDDSKSVWQADCSGRLTALKWIVPRRWSSSWPKRTGLFRISLSCWRVEVVDGVPTGLFRLSSSWWRKW